MSEGKHTPGQCKDCRQGYTRDGNAAYPDHVDLCPLHAAAPELLAACRAVLCQSDVYNTPLLSGIRKKLQAAIAKAEGK